MSRLYEALSRAAIEPRPSETVPFAPRKAVEESRNVAPSKLVETEADAATGAARVVTLSASPASHLVAWSDPNSLGAEKFRALVTRLDHMRRQTKLKSLQVTSSTVNEGKTLVAANLAVTLAKHAGAKTLLLEGDLHGPTLASLFGLSELQGLAHWWSGRDQEIGHFLYQFDGMPLWFLPAGMPCEQPSEVLRSARLSAAFSQLANSFDWIVVDSTPMLPIVDVNLWSRLVDGTLLVVRQGVAPVKALKNGLESLDHPKLIGVVVNEASQSDQEYDKGNYYSSRANRRKAAGEAYMFRTSTNRP